MRKCFCLLILCLLLTSCGSGEPPVVECSDFLLNTTVSIKLYGDYDQDIAQGALDLCRSYELVFSRTDPRSELYQLNHGQSTTVSGELAKVIQSGLRYSNLSQGAFDITTGALSDLWQFTAPDPVVPDTQSVDEALSHVDWRAVTVEGNTVTMPEGTVIDLGGIAKGYIADQVAEYLQEEGVTSAIINLGGNLYCLGSKPDGSDFQVGIQYPYQQENVSIATVEIHDLSVVTSGIYQRYFEVDGQLYHHILDTETGYPVDNELLSVTILCPSSTDADALTTACFALGLDEGMALVDSLPNVYAIFITNDFALHFSSGLTDTYTVKH